MVTHERGEYWGLLGVAWTQPGRTFTHREDWIEWCPYCRAKKEAKDAEGSR